MLICFSMLAGFLAPSVQSSRSANLLLLLCQTLTDTTDDVCHIQKLWILRLLVHEDIQLEKPLTKCKEGGWKVITFIHACLKDNAAQRGDRVFRYQTIKGF